MSLSIVPVLATTSANIKNEEDKLGQFIQRHHDITNQYEANMISVQTEINKIASRVSYYFDLVKKTEQNLRIAKRYKESLERRVPPALPGIIDEARRKIEELTKTLTDHTKEIDDANRLYENALQLRHDLQRVQIQWNSRYTKKLTAKKERLRHMREYQLQLEEEWDKKKRTVHQSMPIVITNAMRIKQALQQLIDNKTNTVLDPQTHPLFSLGATIDRFISVVKTTKKTNKALYYRIMMVTPTSSLTSNSVSPSMQEYISDVFHPETTHIDLFEDENIDAVKRANHPLYKDNTVDSSLIPRISSFHCKKDASVFQLINLMADFYDRAKELSYPDTRIYGVSLYNVVWFGDRPYVHDLKQSIIEICNTHKQITTKNAHVNVVDIQKKFMSTSVQAVFSTPVWQSINNKYQVRPGTRADGCYTTEIEKTRGEYFFNRPLYKYLCGIDADPELASEKRFWFKPLQQIPRSVPTIPDVDTSTTTETDFDVSDLGSNYIEVSEDEGVPFESDTDLETGNDTAGYDSEYSTESEDIVEQPSVSTDDIPVVGEPLLLFNDILSEPESGTESVPEPEITPEPEPDLISGSESERGPDATDKTFPESRASQQVTYTSLSTLRTDLVAIQNTVSTEIKNIGSKIPRYQTAIKNNLTEYYRVNVAPPRKINEILISNQEHNDMPMYQPWQNVYTLFDEFIEEDVRKDLYLIVANAILGDYSRIIGVSNKITRHISKELGRYVNKLLENNEIVMPDKTVLSSWSEIEEYATTHKTTSSPTLSAVIIAVDFMKDAIMFLKGAYESYTDLSPLFGVPLYGNTYILNILCNALAMSCTRYRPTSNEQGVNVGVPLRGNAKTNYIIIEGVTETDNIKHPFFGFMPVRTDFPTSKRNVRLIDVQLTKNPNKEIDF